MSKNKIFALLFFWGMISSFALPANAFGGGGSDDDSSGTSCDGLLGCANPTAEPVPVEGRTSVGGSSR